MKREDAIRAVAEALNTSDGRERVAAALGELQEGEKGLFRRFLERVTRKGWLGTRKRRKDRKK